ncbi:hypothetical protein ACOMHN_066354 [Nucella lapillus]
MKAAGLFTETLTGGKQSATTSGVPASSTSCSSTLHQVTSGVPASSTSCSSTLNKRQKWKPQKAKLLKLKAPHTEEGQNNARRLSKEVKNLPLMKKSL